MSKNIFVRSLCLLTLAVMINGPRIASPAAAAVSARHFDIPGPVGSGEFGSNVLVVANGNIVVSDPLFDDGDKQDVGAVYLYDGTTLALISRLTGGTANDQVGAAILDLPNGNYLVASKFWDNGPFVDVGSVTWCSGVVGCDGVVTIDNSLVGGNVLDTVGYSYISDKYNTYYALAVDVLMDGNYVVRSENWNGPSNPDVGAITLCSGETGCAGVVSSANSLVGSSFENGASYEDGWKVRVLANGSYVVVSPGWDNAAVQRAGAITWCEDIAHCSGVISSANSLVGSTTDDLGNDISVITPLSNGNYVVNSPYWDNGPIPDVGAVTWCSGLTGCQGVIDISNSLIGNMTRDDFYDETHPTVVAPNNENQTSVAEVSNGHYVAVFPFWKNGDILNAGAVTWCDGNLGCVGYVSGSNSLVGSQANDLVGSGGVALLVNGNYVVSSPTWDRGSIVNAGAATWCNGVSGCVGTIDQNPSLVGSAFWDSISFEYRAIQPLSDGDYVVGSPLWDNGSIVDAGAVTWCDGQAGCNGEVTRSNSLVGDSDDSRLGYDTSVRELSNGAYLVSSAFWNRGTIPDAGAVTWCPDKESCVGEISSNNSLLGASWGDRVGGGFLLPNGNYLAGSPDWNNGPISDAGAVTWCSAARGCRGEITAQNSLVGTVTGQTLGKRGTMIVGNGDYVVAGDLGVTWCEGDVGCVGTTNSSNTLSGAYFYEVNAMADGNYVALFQELATFEEGITLGDGRGPFTVGTVSEENSIFRIAAWGYDSVRHRLVAGRPDENIVTLFQYPPLEVQADGLPILNGDTTPSPSDQTDFGLVAVSSEVFTHTYSLVNRGETAISVSDISISGANAGDFQLSGISLPVTVTQASPVTFQVSFAPTELGQCVATITLIHSEVESPHTFTVQGMSLPNVYRVYLPLNKK